MRIDAYKVFLIAMSVLIVGLAVAILLTVSKMRSYEESLRAAKQVDFEKLAEEVETLKAFQAREEEGQRVDLDNPMTYILDKATQARIDRNAIDGQPDNNKSASKGFEEQLYKLTINAGLERQTLADFLFRLESGSSLLKVAKLLMIVDRKAEREDIWNPIVSVGYRRPYSRD